VQVCLNKTQDRVKGVRLFASKFDAQSGILERTGTTKSFKRANCDEKDGCSWPTTCSSTRPRAPSAPTSPHQGRVGGRHHQQHHPGGFGVKAMNLEGNSFLVNWPYNPDPDSSNVGAVELYHKECCGELNVEANLFAFNPGGAMQHDWAEDRMPKFTVKDNLFFMNATLFGDARGEAGLFVGKFGPSPKHNVITVEQAADDYGYKMSGNVSFDPKVPVTLVELKAADVSGVTAKKSVMNDVRALFGANLEGDTVAIKNFAPAWPSTRRPCPFRRSRRRRPTAPRRPG